MTGVTGIALQHQLSILGVRPGSVLLVHSAFSRVQPVQGGPLGLIGALEAVIGPAGTLVMPSMTDDDEQVFDPATTPCAGMGIIADTFWRQPGVLRSRNPHAFAARGPAAEFITSPHPLDVPHGLDSPVGRVYQLDGMVLLLGIGHDGDTTVHLAENLAGVRYRLAHHVTILQAGRPARLDYGETDHCCERFALVDGWLDGEKLQSRGSVGNAEARLIRSRAIVDTVTLRLRRDETIFLHPPGVDAECDEARASLLQVATRECHD
jgi:aminoglycoside N3'-acetyltransferase